MCGGGKGWELPNNLETLRVQEREGNQMTMPEKGLFSCHYL